MPITYRDSILSNGVKRPFQASLLSALFSSVLLLSACGGGGSDSAAGTAVESSATTTASADDTAPDAASKRARSSRRSTTSTTTTDSTTTSGTSTTVSSTTSGTSTGTSTGTSASTGTSTSASSSSSTSSGTSTASASPTITASPGVIPRKMVLAIGGDSIANGSGPANGVNESQYVSFRGPLYQALTTAGATVTMVGTNSTPVRDNLGPAAHSAQGGALLDTSPVVTSISQLMDNLKAANPNGPYDNWVYVLEGGTNNIYTQNPTEIAAKWAAIIQKEQTLFPGSTLVMVGMMPAAWIDSSFYSAINPVLAAHDNGGKLVNGLMANAGMTTSDYMPDATHLSKAGSVKVGNWLAQRIAARMQ